MITVTVTVVLPDGTAMELHDAWRGGVGQWTDDVVLAWAVERWEEFNDQAEDAAWAAWAMHGCVEA